MCVLYNLHKVEIGMDKRKRGKFGKDALIVLQDILMLHIINIPQGKEEACLDRIISDAS